eukprot:CAMPEP_0116104202 /NCGR_PEP_ID=MMETSP0327-20121206/14318_1 /TAXON_ID=44447 /ORGANISM="Pseudo-nitzschia delicatissima, Strain B596" /LENGTH=1065 /DNA_ID=CAMNT_0003596415 /DNA_START=80 /DNA_END=3277 /DNA_ORIENTATION=-
MSRREGFRNYNHDNYDPYNQHRAADHGENFVPGSESAPNLAPQALDHFKRGHRERTNQRERDSYEGGGPPPSNNNNSNGGPPHHDSRRAEGTTTREQGPMSPRFGDRPPMGSRGGRGYRGGDGDDFPRRRGFGRGRGGRGRGGRDYRGDFRGRGDRRPSFHGDRDDRRGGQQIIMGLDIQALVDRLVRPGCDVFRELGATRQSHMAVFSSGKAVTAIISNLARRRNLRIANAVWDWIDYIGIEKNTFHYNSMISACEKVRDYNKALRLLDEMKEKKVAKNEVTFSSAISACEKCGQWRTALDLLDQMKKEGAGQTAIAYNAAISACEKGLVPHKALEIFEQMKREGVRPTVVTYSALISAAEKGQQWKLALEVLEEMKAAGHGANVIAYSAAISALSKGQMWHKALELFREIEASGGKPSIVTYNATMTALEKGLQWERALDLFDEMKSKNMPVTVVSYGSAISACEKGLQYRQCLEYLDEMTEMGIKKNVIIFGAAMSCMEKSCRADIGFLLMERMRLEDVAPNVHIYNSAISACARCNLWEKGFELFEDMDRIKVSKDVVTYNAVLDAVSSQVELGRRLFKEGVEKGFYARVSRLGTQWLELDLHFLSLGGGEIALGWWFEECLVPYLINTSKLEAVQSISIVTGYGKTRSRGARMNDDGMRLRVRAMLKYMDIHETPQPNKGRIHIDKAALVRVVKNNAGRIKFDLEGYTRFKEEETTANKFPDVVQKVRPRFRPARPGQGPPGTFIRDGDPVPPYKSPAEERRDSMMDSSMRRPSDNGYPEYQDNRRPRDDRGRGFDPDDRMHGRSPSNYNRPSESWNQDQRHGGDDWRGGNAPRRDSYNDYKEGRRGYRGERADNGMDRRGSRDFNERPGTGNEIDRRGGGGGEGQQEAFDRRSSNRSLDSRNNAIKSDRDYDPNMRGPRGDDRTSRPPMNRTDQGSAYYPEDRRNSFENRSGGARARRPPHFNSDRPPVEQDDRFRGGARTNDNDFYQKQQQQPPPPPSRGYDIEPPYKGEPESPGNSAAKKRSYDDYQKQQQQQQQQQHPPSRGYDIEPAYSKRRGSL